MSRLEIQAGPHERVQCPVAVPAGAENIAALLVAGGGGTIPVQRAEDGPWCVLPYLAAGAAARVAHAVCDVDTSDRVRISDQGERLEVSVDGMRWCDYHYAGQSVRSYLHPVIGPSGVPMTRAWPLAEGVPGEETDHPHHRSFWVAHGRVNGVDFWSEEAGHGYQVHGGFDAVQSGPVFGRIVQRVSWRRDAPDGAPVMEERRSLTFWNTPATARLLDLALTFHAAHGDVTFGDTKEGGLCALRVPEAIKGARGGVISNAYGGLHEAENWGQRAPWVDYSGQLTDREGMRRSVGVAIFDHPRNPHFPTHWHVRGYGLFAANPFGLADYGSGYRRNGDWTLVAGERATFRYRVLWHAGDVSDARVGDRYLDWAAPPEVAVAD